MMMQLCCPELTNRTLDLTNEILSKYSHRTPLINKKNIARRIFCDCHAMTQRIPLGEYQLSDVQKNMLGHSDHKDPCNWL